MVPTTLSEILDLIGFIAGFVLCVFGLRVRRIKAPALVIMTSMICGAYFQFIILARMAMRLARGGAPLPAPDWLVTINRCAMFGSPILFAVGAIWLTVEIRCGSQSRTSQSEPHAAMGGKST